MCGPSGPVQGFQKASSTLEQLAGSCSAAPPPVVAPPVVAVASVVPPPVAVVAVASVVPPPVAVVAVASVVPPPVVPVVAVGLSPPHAASITLSMLISVITDKNFLARYHITILLLGSLVTAFSLCAISHRRDV